MDLVSELKGNIFDIQGFSVHDGPGNRTSVFFQGCSLNCFWCSNPEGINHSANLLYYSEHCIQCKECIDICEHNAIHAYNGSINFNRKICENCEEKICVDICNTDALRLSSRKYTVDELFKIIQRDRSFWGDKGGVTLTGGEPLLQINFVEAILKKCYNSYIHTAIETCGFVPWKNFETVIDYLDWIFFDLKHFDSKNHKIGTGYNNKIILDNIQMLDQTYNSDIIFRFPLIPGYNDSEDNINGISKIILNTKWRTVNVLPLHHFGRNKYQLLGKEYKALQNTIPSKGQLTAIQSFFVSKGLTCFIDSETEF